MSSVIDGFRQAQCLAVAVPAVSCSRSAGRQRRKGLTYADVALCDICWLDRGRHHTSLRLCSCAACRRHCSSLGGFQLSEYILFVTVVTNLKHYNGTNVVCNSGRLLWPGSSEWCVVEAHWQRGNSRLLHDSSDVDTHLWSDWQMDRNFRQLHATYDSMFTI